MHNILLIEDDEIDIMNIERAFKKANIPNKLHKAHNGIEALEILNNNKISNPIVILLDLNMPQMNGFEFLEEVKKDDRFKTIPVVILTSSQRDQDILLSYQKQVAGYLVKPVSTDKLTEILNTVNNYWSLCCLYYAK